MVTSGFHLFYLSAHFCYTRLLWGVHCKASTAWKHTHTNNLQDMVLQYVPICDRSKTEPWTEDGKLAVTFSSLSKSTSATLSVKLSVYKAVSVSWGLSAETQIARCWASGLEETLAYCHLSLWDSAHVTKCSLFSPSPDSSDPCPGPCAVLCLTLFFFFFKLSKLIIDWLHRLGWNILKLPLLYKVDWPLQRTVYRFLNIALNATLASDPAFTREAFGVGTTPASIAGCSGSVVPFAIHFYVKSRKSSRLCL